MFIYFIYFLFGGEGILVAQASLFNTDYNNRKVCDDSYITIFFSTVYTLQISNVALNGWSQGELCSQFSYNRLSLPFKSILIAGVESNTNVNAVLHSGS